MRNFIHLFTLEVLVSSSSTPPISFQPVSRSSSSSFVDEDDLPFAFPAFPLEGLTVSGMFEDGSSATSTTTTLPPISIDALLRAGQFEEAIELVTPTVFHQSGTSIFNEAERNRIMEIFKAGIDHERAKYREFTQAMTRSGTRARAGSAAAATGHLNNRLSEYPDAVVRDKAARTINRYCMLLIQIFTNQLNLLDQNFFAIPRAYLQALMGDMYRYISEVTHGDDKRYAEELGLSLYADALHVYYHVGVPVDDSERLRVQTNRELLMHSVPSLRRAAIESLEQTVRELELEFIRRPGGATSRAEFDFVSILRARLKLWKDQLQDDEWIVL